MLLERKTPNELGYTREAGSLFDDSGVELGRYLYCDRGDQEILDEILHSIIQYSKEDPNYFCTLDLETTGLNALTGEILLVSIALNSTDGFVFCPHYFDLTVFKELLKLVPIANQNLKFDVKWLKHHYGIMPNCVFDTMLAAILGYGDLMPKIYSGDGKARQFSLDNIAKRVLSNLSLGKGTRSEFIGRKLEQGFTKRQVEYAAKDSVVTFKLVYPLTKRLMNEELWDIFTNMEMPLVPILALSELTGIVVDVEKITTYMGALEVQRFSIDKELQDVFMSLSPEQKKLVKSKSGTFNPGSSVQVVGFLEALGIQISNTEEGTLNTVAGETGNPYIPKIIKWRKLNKLITSFLETWTTKHIYPLDNSVHTSYNILGAGTGRLCVDVNTYIETDHGPVRIGDVGNYQALKALTHADRYMPITDLIYKGEEEMFEVELETGNKIICTANHRFLTPDGWVPLESMNEAASLLHSENKKILVSRIKSIKPVGVRGVWDITVEEDHSYVAHGFINHNSSSDPNLQQVPRELRGMFIARKGWRIVSCDYAQYELRAAAAATQEPYLLNAFNERQRLLPLVSDIAASYGVDDADVFVKKILKGEVEVKEEDRALAMSLADTDVHKRNAALVTGTSVSEVGDRERQIGKTLGYAILYGSGPPTLQESLAKTELFFSLAECQVFIDTFFDRLPRVKQFIEDSHKAVEKSRVVETTMGRKKYFALPPKYASVQYKQALSQSYRQGTNFFFQGANADATKLAIKALYEKFQAYDKDIRPRILLNVHDEVVFEVHDSNISEIIPIIRETMIWSGLESVGHRVAIEVSISVGERWTK